jgi:hypothetical protein
VADEGSCLVQAAPQVASDDHVEGVAGVEVGGGEEVPDGVDGGFQ